MCQKESSYSTRNGAFGSLFWCKLLAASDGLPATAFYENTPYTDSDENKNPAGNSTGRRAFSVTDKDPHGIENWLDHSNQRAFYRMNAFETIRKNGIGNADLYDTQIRSHQKIRREYRGDMYQCGKADKADQNITPEDTSSMVLRRVFALSEQKSCKADARAQSDEIAGEMTRLQFADKEQRHTDKARAYRKDVDPFKSGFEEQWFKDEHVQRSRKLEEDGIGGCSALSCNNKADKNSGVENGIE